MPEQCRLRYRRFLQKKRTRMAGHVRKLHGNTLVCGCPSDQACIADTIIMTVFEADMGDSADAGELKVIKKWDGPARDLPRAAVAKSGRNVAAMPQGIAVAALKSLYSKQRFDGVWFPLNEDIVNGPTFASYREWRRDRDAGTDEPWVKTMMPMCSMYATRGTCGPQ